jgi:hypothetical protein
MGYQGTPKQSIVAIPSDEPLIRISSEPNAEAVFTLVLLRYHSGVPLEVLMPKTPKVKKGAAAATRTAVKPIKVIVEKRSGLNCQDTSVR